MTKKTKLSRLAAWLLILALLLGSFPVVYSEGAEEGAPAENVTEVVQEPAPEVTEPEPAPAPAEPEPAPEPAPAPVEPEPAPAEEPVQAEPVQEPEPVVEQPVVEEPVVEEPVVEEPVVEQPVVEEPPVEQPVVEEPVVEEPVVEEPVPEQPAVEEPEITPGPEENPGEISSEEISGSPAPEMDDEFDDFGDDEFDDDFDQIDDFDDFDEFEEEPESETADVSGDEDLVEFGENDAGSVSEEFLEPFNNLDDYVQVEFNGCADIELKNEGDLEYGDEIILKAKVQDTNVSYRLIWEANDGDERGWYTVGSGDEYKFTLEEENVDRGYRVVIYTVD